MTCDKQHRYYEIFKDLPGTQANPGRHHCAGCAYELGYDMGLRRATNFAIDLDQLPDSQAGTVRHKSAHAAFALGFLDGVKESYDS